MFAYQKFQKLAPTIWPLITSNNAKLHENSYVLCTFAKLLGKNGWLALSQHHLMPGNLYEPKNVNPRFINPHCLYHYDDKYRNDRLTISQLQGAFEQMMYEALFVKHWRLSTIQMQHILWPLNMTTKKLQQKFSK